MVVGPILREVVRTISRQGIRQGTKILTAEGNVLNFAWRGYKHKSSIVSGIRSGLLTGAVLGSFITDDSSDPFNGKIPQFNPPGKGGQKYSRRNFSRRRSNRTNYCKPRRYRKRLHRSNRYSSYR